MKQIMIRQCKEADFEELMNIDHIVFNSTNTPALICHQTVEEYAKHYSLESLFVAEIESHIAGYIGYTNPTGLESNRHVMEIYIAVHPDHQNMGVGRELLNYISSWGKQNGFHKVSLRVLSTNEAAVRFYSSNGFKEQGRLIKEFILNDKLVDDILMYKIL